MLFCRLKFVQTGKIESSDDDESDEWIIGKIYLCHVEEIKVNDLRFDMLYFSNHVVGRERVRERESYCIQENVKNAN